MVTVTSMQHLNGNLLCSIDCETTGLRAGYHDLIQIGIVPANGKMEPMLEPFYITMQPERPENIDERAMRINKISRKVLDNAVSIWTGQELLEDWFEKTVTANGFKKIVPLGQNFQFDQGFIKDWLGQDMQTGKDFSDDFFNFRDIRDTKITALFLNDLAYQLQQDFPFPKTNLAYLCSQFRIKRHNAHDALGDCYDTLEVYRRMLALQIKMLDFGAVT